MGMMALEVEYNPGEDAEAQRTIDNPVIKSVAMQAIIP